MEAQRLQDVAEEAAGGLLAAELEHPFGPDCEVYKVGGKMFLLSMQLRGTPLATVKCAPEDVTALVQRYDDITTGYHLNKRHWISVWPGEEVDDDLLRDLVKNSYLLVADSIPRSRRPLTSEVRFSTDTF
ncbi:MmcQ/YjbR family DNA-binding protein [Saccharopolyspora flava]|uniref:Predicted DNA-binding protein, MmcQ/YjbR family n=1 Tax=Saccharopolyspora flava TaxID=95161 RepID=A0A1I6SB39_9PSEU|nr:MmcQ/YjbR family DNA-binding protein [Saccharopolyspora flava]SFS74123.1 Predicted DNA-binding protein, MmcQ/YjbR family [Saccharopolyspora flava]